MAKDTRESDSPPSIDNRGNVSAPVSERGGPKVGNETANLDVSRVVTLVGTSIAIFTFLLFFLYPRFSSNEIDPILFQVTLIVIGLAIFSLVYAGLFFYTLTLPYSLGATESAAIQRRGACFGWSDTPCCCLSPV